MAMLSKCRVFAAAGLFAAFTHQSFAGGDARMVVRVGPSLSVRTPVEARDAVRMIKAAEGGRMPECGITVEFEDGTYLLDEPLELDDRDSGSPAAPIVWRAKNRGSVTFSGARELGKWTNVADREELELLPTSARWRVFVADVPAGLEIPDFHGGGEECYSKRLNFPLWLYQDGKRLDCARYPNSPRNLREHRSGYLFTGSLTHGSRGSEFKVENLHERLAVWAREPDLWVYGLFLHDYADMKMRVVGVDTVADAIKVDNRWYQRGFARGRPFHVFNALSEIDMPGEWMMDRARRRVYLLPIADVAAHPPVLGVTPYLVTGTNVSDVVFEGLSFCCCRRDALRFDGCRNVEVCASTISLTGAWGVTVNGGSGCRVEGCDLSNLGEGGVRLQGGDWSTLTPAGHVADNNHIARFGEVIPSYRPGVSLAGVGNRCTHNLIHHTRHQAVWFNGNDHEIGFNVIHDTCLYNDDAGAIYCCQRDFTKRGTVIEYNLVHATGRRPHPTNVHCIYLDDWSSGTEVRGNILNQATYGLHLGGGQGTVATNNIIVGCEEACHLGHRRWPKHFPNGVIGTDSRLYRKLAENADLWESPAWKGRYPHMLDPLSISDKVVAHDPINCVVVHNLIWASGIFHFPPYRELEQYRTVADNLVCTNNPGVVGYGDLDFSFEPDSPAWAFFGGDSRFCEMGLYDSPLRASPPVKFGPDVSPAEVSAGEPRQMLSPAVIRIDVVVEELPDGVAEVAHGLENAFILESSKGRRIVGFSEKDEAPCDGHWKQCCFSFVPNFDGTASLVLSGRFGAMTEYRSVSVTGAELDGELSGAANHNRQKSSKLTFREGQVVRVEFEARCQPD